jgi:hypothetical protein
MYRKNTASQYIYFVLVKAADGTALTGATVTAYRALDNGSQASATGTTTELAHGQYRFNLSQADTNADYGSYLFTATNAVPVEKTVVFTGANPTDATAFGLSRLDAAITSRLAPTTAGRTLGVDASGQITVGAMAANTLTASALATDAVNEIANASTQLLYSDIIDSNFVWDGVFWDRINERVQTIYRLGLMIESNNLGDFRFDTFALSNAGDAQQSTLLAVKAKTDLITSTTNFITVERVAGSTITMYYNEATTATVGLDENTSSLTLRFVVENSDQLDVLVIENANITRTASNFTVTITTAVTATLGQYRWALRDITGGVNRLIEGGVLQVVGAANKDA